MRSSAFSTAVYSFFLPVGAFSTAVYSFFLPAGAFSTTAGAFSTAVYSFFLPAGAFSTAAYSLYCLFCGFHLNYRRLLLYFTTLTLQKFGTLTKLK